MNQTPNLASDPNTPAGHAVPPVPRNPVRVAIVAASWHRDLVQNTTAAIQQHLAQNTPPPQRVDVFEVPGAFEIPLHAQRLAQSRRYDAIIACALVVNGGIYRHEFVASAVIDGLMRVQLDSGTPVFSVVLTPRDFHEHAEHHQFFAEHLKKKGAEAAQACLATVASLEALR